jgi:hypothetical protein
MTNDGHDKGSKKIHKKRREDVKAVDRKMNQEEFDKEFTEVKERLSIILKFLQESNEDHRWGWNVKKNVKWPIV